MDDLQDLTLLRAGSRDSALALAQTRLVMAALKAQHPDIDQSLETFKTQGDLILDTALSKIGDKGLFVKELEVALLEDRIDFAVHSLKDMPGEQPEGLTVFTFGKREAPHDALVSASGQTFWELAAGSRIGTSSLRRQALLNALRPDLTYVTVRGNLQTRLRKLDEGQFDALILAEAGLVRMGLGERITHVFSTSELLPACCQGILGIEVASPRVAALFCPLIDADTQVQATAERAFLKTLQGGCQIPMAAYAEKQADGQFILSAMVCSLDGQTRINATQIFDANHASQAGQQVAQDILDSGGREILNSL